MRLFSENSYITIDFKKNILEEYQVSNKKPTNEKNSKIDSKPMPENIGPKNEENHDFGRLLVENGLQIYGPGSLFFYPFSDLGVGIDF